MKEAYEQRIRQRTSNCVHCGKKIPIPDGGDPYVWLCNLCQIELNFVTFTVTMTRVDVKLVCDLLDGKLVNVCGGDDERSQDRTG